MPRPQDRVQILANGKAFELFEKVEIQWDLAAPMGAVIEFGDDGGWNALASAMQPGTPWSVALNGVEVVKGCVQLIDTAGDDRSGVGQSLAIRSRLADAFVASADPATKITGSVLDLVLALLGQVGYVEADIVTDHRTSVKLLSGSPPKGQEQKTDLEPLQFPQAKVQPGESVMECLTRHCDRHGLIIVDLPGGKVGIFKADTELSSEYSLRMKRGGSRADRQANNIARFRRTADWTNSPSELTLYGQTWGGELAKASIKATVANPELIAAQQNGFFKRPIITVQNQIQDRQQATRKAAKLLSTLVPKQDSWDIFTDGLTYWDGAKQKRWALTSMVDMDVDVVGGPPTGRYFIHKVSLKQDDQGSTARISVVRSDLIFDRETGLLGRKGDGTTFAGPFKTPEFNFEER